VPASDWNKLEGNLFVLRLGPFLELPFGDGFFSRLGGGLSLMFADTDYSHRNRADFANESVWTAFRDASSRDLLFSGYLQGQVGCLLTEKWSVFGGVRLETASALTTTTGEREAKLNLDEAIHAVLGIGYSF
jgi:hypothetical protein